MSTYVLPELGYDYAALEPAISAKIMELHHSKHHNTYVQGANATLDKLADARENNDFGAIVGLEKTLAFNVGGHAMHTVFWKNLAPGAEGRPEGELASAIDEFFGSYDKFNAHMTAAATTIQGSGWAALAWEPIGERLIIHQLSDHMVNMSMSAQPLLVFDMWEHAFYLDYLNVKPDYVKALWTIVNWQDVAQRLEMARAGKQTLVLPKA